MGRFVLGLVVIAALAACESTTTASGDRRVCDAAGRAIDEFVNGLDRGHSPDEIVTNVRDEMETIGEFASTVRRERLRELAEEVGAEAENVTRMEDLLGGNSGGSLLTLDGLCIDEGLT